MPLRRPRIKPRTYQVEALEWALKQEQSVLCMPTGTGKTIVAGLWIRRLLEARKARKALVLEPTRFLVEQTSKVLRELLGLDARPLHGSLPRPERERAWGGEVVVATPEIIVSEWERFKEEGFDALVVDECHHTTGQDPYKQVVQRHFFPYRLGLTAHVPPGRKKEIEEYIGRIRCWSWEHPEIARYVPPYAAEIYEAELNPVEYKLYTEIESRWESTRGRNRALLGLALRWLVRDGAESLRESYERSRRIRALLSGLEELIFHPDVRPAHKLGALNRVLLDHEGYEKAIVFIDRVVIARLVSKALEGWGHRTALILGRRQVEPRAALERARRRGVDVIISTSAGEEGIDLPEADLLIVWSHTSSPLRFIQRLGRLLRPSPRRPQKAVVFIVTPDTVDVDSLIDGLSQAAKAGVHVPVETDTVRALIEKSRHRRLLEPLYTRPMPSDMLAQLLGAPRERVEAGLRWLQEHGYVAYIYTPLGKTYFPADRPDLAMRYHGDSLTPDPLATATVRVQCDDGEWKGMRQSPYTRAVTILRRLLERCRRFKTVKASVFFVDRGLVRMKTRTYSFPVENYDLLEVVARNVYTRV
ncbi:MAG: DEAD/DEAH box helicase family protein [Desulfurococcales archaeon]|nr:DEAD/DEAH box helicase family protein [Desulfurococcales archaeon]